MNKDFEFVIGSTSNHLKKRPTAHFGSSLLSQKFSFCKYNDAQINKVQFIEVIGNTSIHQVQLDDKPEIFRRIFDKEKSLEKISKMILETPDVFLKVQHVKIECHLDCTKFKDKTYILYFTPIGLNLDEIGVDSYDMSPKTFPNSPSPSPTIGTIVITGSDFCKE
jgi:hypothetical protein